MNINLQNIEEIIFYNKRAWDALPDLQNYYDQWCLSQRASGLKNFGKRIIIDFMASLTDGHVEKLQEFFQETIILEKIDTNLLSCLEASKSDLEQNLCKYDNYKDFFVTRNKDDIKVCFWR